jgi:hypothetical protein
MVKETNIDCPLSPIMLHQVVPRDTLSGELMRPIEKGMRIAIDNSFHNGIPAGLVLTTPVTAIQETEEANIVRVTTCNSVYLVTYLPQSQEQVPN